MRHKRVLVVYGSKSGGTAGLAKMVGCALRAQGCDVVAAQSALWTRQLRDIEAVVVGGALYRDRWHWHARQFVWRHRAELRNRDVWFFSSGPLDDSARDGSIPPSGQVLRLMELVSARGHMTFGGCRMAEVSGTSHFGLNRPDDCDWRDPVHVTGWARAIARELGSGAPCSTSGSAPAPNGTDNDVKIDIEVGQCQMLEVHGVPEARPAVVGGMWPDLNEKLRGAEVTPGVPGPD
jgi:menaquinone-dependent protoporphyrinogen oxidase